MPGAAPPKDVPLLALANAEFRSAGFNGDTHWEPVRGDAGGVRGHQQVPGVRDPTVAEMGRVTGVVRLRSLHERAAGVLRANERENA